MNMVEEIHEYDVVALIKDLPEDQLSAGQTGTVVFVHNRGEAFEVEFMLDPRHSVVATVERPALLKLKGHGYSKAS